jgi:TolB-like protein/Flp pilus assembly protein TadD/DNA-binding winged helix-turn-helix (wHTH) protein
VRAQLLRGFYLGDVLVEPLKGLITSDGSPRELPPEAVDVLLHLASLPGEVVRRHILIDEVWGREHGSHEALNHAIVTLRNALDDHGSRPRFIETVSDRGYRLLADVRLRHFDEKHAESDEFQRIENSDSNRLGGLALLWDELNKRRVVRVGIGYLVSAWVVLQIGDVIAGVLELPSWAMKLVTVLLAAGFVITVVTSWLLQVTPEGIVLDRSGDKAKHREWLHYAELSLIVVLLIAVGIMGYRLTWREIQPGVDAAPGESIPGLPPGEGSSMPAYEASIAVLPFESMSDDPEDRYFCDGLAEELIHKLVKAKSLKVAARTSSFHVGSSKTDIPTIARTLNVGNVLEGSVRREGDRLRVTAQLVDAQGFHLWSEAYDAGRGEILALQSDIALQVARQITSDLSPDIHDAISKWSTNSIEAYEQYLRGLDFLRQPRQQETLARAAGFFDRAIGIDPRFARAYAGACETELSFYRLNRDLENFEKAERFCNRALTLDADLPEVHTALGNLYRSSSQFEKAQASFEKALQMNPYFEEANYGLARSLQGQGNLKEAERLLRFSVALEPGYWGPHMSLGYFLHHLGRFEESIPYFEKVTELTPDNPDGYTNLGTAYFDLGDWDNAARAWSRSVELKPTPMGFRNMGTLYYYQARYEDAVAMHTRAAEMAPEDHWVWGRLAAAFRYVEGGREDSRQAYRRAIELAEQRLTVDEKDAKTMAPLAAYYVNIGDEDRASEYARRAVALDPEYPTAWYFSAIVNVRTGKPDRALEDLRQAVDLGYSKRLLTVDPQFDGLKDRPAFKALIL